MTEKLKLKLDCSLKGRILDIGGGGEGIIGRIYRQQVMTREEQRKAIKTDVQNRELFVSMCQEAGMTLLKKAINNTQIYLQFSKTAQ